jgi:hypothetical protein
LISLLSKSGTVQGIAAPRPRARSTTYSRSSASLRDSCRSTVREAWLNSAALVVSGVRQQRGPAVGHHLVLFKAPSFQSRHEYPQLGVVGLSADLLKMGGRLGRDLRGALPAEVPTAVLLVAAGVYASSAPASARSKKGRLTVSWPGTGFPGYKVVQTVRCSRSSALPLQTRDKSVQRKLGHRQRGLGDGPPGRRRAPLRGLVPGGAPGQSPAPRAAAGGRAKNW